MDRLVIDRYKITHVFDVSLQQIFPHGIGRGLIAIDDMIGEPERQKIGQHRALHAAVLTRKLRPDLRDDARGATRFFLFLGHLRAHITSHV